MAKHNTGKTGKSAASKAKPGAFQLSKEPFSAGRSDLDVHKFELTPEGEAPMPSPAHEQPAFEQLGELPQSYGETTLYLVARDPHWLFSYWEIDRSAYPAAQMRGGEHKF